MVYMTNKAAAEGGALSYHINGGTAGVIATDTHVVKAAPGVLYSVTLISVVSTLGYFRLYDSAMTPTVSSATNARPAIPVPASGTGAGVTVTFGPAGMQFENGISFCVSGGGGDTDNTNGPAGIYPILIYY